MIPVCPSFSLLYSVPVNKYISTYLSMLLFGSIWVVSSFVFIFLLQTMLSTFSHMSSQYTRTSFSLVCTFQSGIVGLENRCTFYFMLIVFPGVYRSCNPTSSVWEIPPPANPQLGVVRLVSFRLSGRCEIVAY